MLAVVSLCSTFVLPSVPLAPASSALACRAPVPATMGLFDMFQESPEQKAAKDRAFKEQQEMLARRRNPEAMEEYFEETEARRRATSASDRELKDLQKGDGSGADKLDMWKKMKEDVSGASGGGSSVNVGDGRRVSWLTCSPIRHRAR